MAFSYSQLSATPAPAFSYTSLADQGLPEPVQPDPTLLQEVGKGASSGADQLQGSLYGLAGILGDATNSPELRAFAQTGAAKNEAEAIANAPSVSGISQIEDTGDFFHWAAGSLGNAIPSLAAAGVAGGVGSAVGRRLVANKLRTAVFDEAKGSALRMGLAGTTEAEAAALGKTLLSKLSDPVTQAAMRRASQIGAGTGLFGSSALPQMGQIQNELSSRGISAPGSAVVGGAAAGALDAFALSRLADKLFPGVEKALRDGFIKDVAKSLGSQAVLEGSTEGAQEIIALSALAFNDPSFDIGAPENRQRILEATAAGALVGAVTGGGARAMGRSGELAEKGKNKLADILEGGLLPEDNGAAALGKVKEAAAGVMGEAADAAKDPASVREATTAAYNDLKEKLSKPWRGSPKLDAVPGVDLNQQIQGELDTRLTAAVNAPAMQANEALKQISDALGGVSKGQRDAAFGEVAAAMRQAEPEFKAPMDEFRQELNNQLAVLNAELLGLKDEAKAKRQAEAHAELVKKIDEFITAKIKPIVDRQAAKVATTLDKAPTTEGEVIQKDLGDEPGDELSFSDLATEDEADAREGADPADLLGTAGMERMTYGRMTDKVDGRTGKKIKVRSSGDKAIAFTDKVDAEATARLLATQNPDVPADSFVVTKRKDGYVVTAVDAVSGSQIRESKQLSDAVDKARLVALNKPDTSQATYTLELHRPGNLNKDGSKRYTRVNAQQLALGGADIESSLTDNGTGTDTLAGFDSAIARLLASGYEVKGGSGALNRVTLRHEQYGDMPVWKYRRAQAKYSTRTRPSPNNVGINARTPVFDRGANPGYEGASELGVNPMRPTGSGLESVPSPEKIGRKTISNPTDDFGGGVDSEVPVLEQGEPKLRRARRAAAGGAFERRPDTRNITNSEATENERSREAPPLRTKFQRSARTPVRVGLSVVDEATNQRVHDLVTEFRKLLGLKSNILVVDPATAATELADHPLAAQIQRTVAEDPNARILMGGEEVIIFLSERMLVDKKTGDEANASVRTFRAVTHELGHLVYQVYFNKLSPELKAKVLKAHEAAAPGTDFEEWAADQLTAWAAKKTAPRNAVESFFKRVTDKIRAIFNALRAKFPLDETFEEFLDGIVASREGKKLNDFAEHFINEGVLGHAWVNPREAVERDLRPANDQDPNLDRRLLRALKRRVRQRLRRYPTLARGAETVARTAMRLHESVTASLQARLRRLPGGEVFADVFHRERGAARDMPTYFNAIERNLKAFAEQFQTTLKGMDEAKQKAVLAELIEADGKSADQVGTLSPEAQAIRATFDKLLAYGREAGLPLNKVYNYFPRVWDTTRVEKGHDDIVDILQKAGLSNADAELAWQSMAMQGSEISADPRLFSEPTNDPPVMTFLKHRKVILGHPLLKKYRGGDLTDILQRYLRSTIARATYNQYFGEPAYMNEDNTDWVWNPQQMLEQKLEHMRQRGAKPEDIRTARESIDALLGRSGREMPADLRNMMAWVMTYQNTRILLFSTLSSLPDIVGPAIRSQSFKLAYGALSKNMAKLVDQSSDLNAMARSFGIISDAFNSHVLSDGFDNHWFPQGARKINDAFFKGIGLQRWTNFTRVAAMATGIEYMGELATKAAAGDAKAVKHLAELGLTHGDVTTWQTNGKRIHGTATYTVDKNTPADKKVADALLQFVNESIMRPNAAQRPGWMSDPRFMLISHLKSFLYTFHDTITSQLIQNFREAGTPLEKAYIVAGPAMALLALTAMGLELREQIQYKLWGRKAPTDSQSAPDYLWTLIQRTGLLGPSMFVVDLESAEKHGNAPLIGLLGPSIEQLNMILAKPATQSVPKSIPFIAQFPAMRDALRGD